MSGGGDQRLAGQGRIGGGGRAGGGGNTSSGEEPNATAMVLIRRASRICVLALREACGMQQGRA